MASRSRLSQTQNLGSAAGSMTLSIAHSSPPVYERASRTNPLVAGVLAPRLPSGISGALPCCAAPVLPPLQSEPADDRAENHQADG